MQVVKRHVYIVLPPGLQEASVDLLTLCELFVGCLLETKESLIHIRVDLPSRSVSCNDERIRETIRLFVGAGNVNGFVLQLTSLLHPSSDRDLLGILVCNESGKMRRFAFQEIGEAIVDWRITAST